MPGRIGGYSRRLQGLGGVVEDRVIECVDEGRVKIQTMVAPQSVVVANAATGTYGSEGSILRFVFLHSFVLVCLMGVLVSLLVNLPSLTQLMVR